MQNSKYNETNLQETVNSVSTVLFDLCDFDFEKLKTQSSRKINLANYDVEKHLIAAAKRIQENNYMLAAYHLDLAIKHFIQTISFAKTFTADVNLLIDIVHKLKDLTSIDFASINNETKTYIANEFYIKSLYSIDVEDFKKHIELSSISKLLDISISNDMIHCYVVDGILPERIDISKIQWLQQLIVTTSVSAAIDSLRTIERTAGTVKIVPILHKNEKISLYSYFILSVITDESIMFFCDNTEFANPYSANTTRNPYRRREEYFENLDYPYYLLENKHTEKYTQLPTNLDFALFTIPMQEIEPACVMFMQFVVSTCVNNLNNNLISAKYGTTMQKQLQVLKLKSSTSISNTNIYTELNDKHRGLSEHIKELEESLIDEQDIQSLVVYNTDVVTKHHQYDPEALLTIERAENQFEWYAREQTRIAIQRHFPYYTLIARSDYEKILAEWLRPLIKTNTESLFELIYSGKQNVYLQDFDKMQNGDSFSSSRPRAGFDHNILSCETRNGNWQSNVDFYANFDYSLCYADNNLNAHRVKTITFNHFRQFIELLNIDRKSIPLLFRNYKSHSYIPYHGNSLLSDVDPIARVVDTMSSKFSNGFTIGFQLSGQADNKLKRKYKRFENSYIDKSLNITDYDVHAAKMNEFYEK